MIEVFDAILRAVAILLILTGTFFFIVGTTGLLRLPDLFCRTHAATKCDTLGAGSILLGLMLYNQFSLDSLKIIAIFLLVLIASPTAGHALARASYVRGLTPWTKKDREVDEG